MISNAHTGYREQTEDEIDLLIVEVRDRVGYPDGSWECVVELGEFGSDDNPWMTVCSDDLMRHPVKGDVIRVRKPKAVCFVNATIPQVS